MEALTLGNVAAAIGFLVTLIGGVGFLMSRTKAWILSAVKDEVERLDGKIDDISTAQNKMEERMDKDAADDARRMILSYNDEILRHIQHSKESFDQILRDVDQYENYSRKHPDYPNNQAVAAIANIKRCYQKCLDESLFLG